MVTLAKGSPTAANTEPFHSQVGLNRVWHIAQDTGGVCWALSQSREAVALKCPLAQVLKCRVLSLKTEDGSKEALTPSVRANNA